MGPKEVEFDVSHFHAGAPVWILVRDGTQASVMTTGVGLFSEMSKSGSRYLPLFTSLEAAEQYAGVATAIGPGLVPLMVADPVQLKRFLKFLKPLGLSHVGFNPHVQVTLTTPQNLIEMMEDPHS